MHAIWNEINGFEISEQKLVGQARVIKKNNWPLDLEQVQLKIKIANEEVGQSQKTETCKNEQGIHNGDGCDSRSVE